MPRVRIADGPEAETRALSFGAVAGEYERTRPGYPLEVARWLTGSPPLEVVDLGAGTGKLTRVLVALGHRVTAVEPLGEMRAELARAVPEARALAGTAEEIPLADWSADAVVAGQAFHWFDLGRALPEIARVLRPGGTLGVVWNFPDRRVDWADRFASIIDETFGNAPETLRRGLAEIPGLAVPFGPVSHREFAHEQLLDRRALVERAATHSAVAIRPPAERARLLAEVDRLWDEHPDLRGRAEAALPYRVDAYRAERLSSAGPSTSCSPGTRSP